MDVSFNQMVFRNKSTAYVTVWLEAPPKSGNYLVKEEKVEGGNDHTFKFEGKNIDAVRIRAESTYGGAKDAQDVSAQCSPYSGFLENLTAEYNPGNLRGSFQAIFLDPSKPD